jgi:hypothetical protein
MRQHSTRYLLVPLLLVVVTACGSSHPRRGVGAAPSSTSDITTTGATPTSGASSPGSTSSQSTTSTPHIDVVEWATDDGLLFVNLVNHSGYEIRSARAVITGRDASGTVVASVSGPPSSRCCTILGLPPGGQFGVYAEVGPSVSRIVDVRVEYADLALIVPPANPATVHVSKPVLDAGNGPAVVTVGLTAHGAVGAYITGLAYLTDPGGALVAIISGRFYCFADGVSRVVHMQLFHRVPVGTRVRLVIAYPVPANMPGVTASLPTCS